ncbi:unnamed protein product [Moneuplotes crassus]|uniref:Uncharacterized protein n=1 Tax=Euplotes crassus TaxID=5936 RepID=A0AAD1U2Q0_EUPCR|nr:unnamed protein product [Moneuplotes crassus]
MGCLFIKERQESSPLCERERNLLPFSQEERRDHSFAIRILYFRLSKVNPLDVYRIPKKDLSQYEIDEEDVNNNEYDPPKEKYLYINSDSDNSSDEDEEEAKDKMEDTGVGLGNKLYQQLGEKYMEKEQKDLRNQNSSLLFSRANRRDIREKYAIKRFRIPEHGSGSIPKLRGERYREEVKPEIESESDEEPEQVIDSNDCSDSSSGSSENSDSEEPTLKDFALIKMINKGGFGKVFLAKNTIDGKYYAMKRIRKDLLIETKQVDNTLNEKEILLSNNNPFLLSMNYVFQSEFRLYFFMQYVNGGNLYENMFKVKRFKEKQVKFFISQVIIALGYLHKNKVVHRDIKPENVILKENGYIVLADFGLAKILDSKSKIARTCCGTAEYIAPEVFQGARQGYTVDWWTVGILAYELLCGKTPFKDSNMKKQKKKILSGKIPWPDATKHGIYMSQDMMDFIKACLEKDPRKRLGAKGTYQLIKHYWFDDIDFNEVLNQEMKAPYLPDVDNIDEEEEENRLNHHQLLLQKKRSKNNKQDLLETMLDESRKRMIRNFQDKFDDF